MVRRACASWPPSTGSRASRWAPPRTTRSPSRRARRSCGSARSLLSLSLQRIMLQGIRASAANTVDCHGIPGHLAPRARLLRPRRGATTRTTTSEPEPRLEPEAELEERYRERPNVRRLVAPPPPRRDRRHLRRRPRRRRGARRRAALRARRRNGDGRRRARAPRGPEDLQRRPAGRRQVQGPDPGHPQPPGLRRPTCPSA